MAANVESMFCVRETPWHGLGTNVQEAQKSEDALIMSGLDWKVVQESIYTPQDELIEGYKANVRNIDRKVLGVVTDRYKVIQNEEAFAFTDELLGEGVRYETAGSLQGGKRVWLLAHMPHEYIISGERISPYLLFSNIHDGSGAIKVALTPIRVVCQNTLNLALSNDSVSEVISLIGFNDKLQRRQEVVELIKKLETEKKQIEQEVKLYMGNAEQAENENFRVSWKPVSKNELDTKRLKEEAPEIYEKYKKKTQIRRLYVKAA